MSNPGSGLPSQGGIQSTTTGVEVMDLTEDSMLERQKHEALLVDLEAKNVPLLSMYRHCPMMSEMLFVAWVFP